MTQRQGQDPRLDTSRTIRAPHGNKLRAKSWLTEAPLRMLMNNLDPDVAEHPHSLVVYGGIGRAARNWECYDKIVEVLERLEDDQTLLVQSGKPVGVFPTHKTHRVCSLLTQTWFRIGQTGNTSTSLISKV